MVAPPIVPRKPSLVPLPFGTNAAAGTLTLKKGGPPFVSETVTSWPGRPSGVSVKCQRERSQALNRFLARRELLDKLEARARGVAEAAAAERARIRRQKRRRSRRAKEKLLAAKRAQSAKKALRRAPEVE